MPTAGKKERSGDEKKEDTGISARCLPEGRKCAVARAFRVCLDILFSTRREIEFAARRTQSPSAPRREHLQVFLWNRAAIIGARFRAVECYRAESARRI